MRDWPVEWPPERIAAAAQRAGATYLGASQPVRLARLVGSEPIEPRTIIEVGELYLVEAVDALRGSPMSLRPNGRLTIDDHVQEQ